MSLSKVNASAATLTKNRTEESIQHISGMCVTCVDGCIGMCEIGKSAYRSHDSRPKKGPAALRAGVRRAAQSHRPQCDKGL